MFEEQTLSREEQRRVGELGELILAEPRLRRAGERSGLVVDLGCGPGHVTAFLAAAGVQVEGFDLSGEMVAQASRRYPTLAFRQGDMRSLAVADAALGGIVAFYSIIHLGEAELVAAFQEWRRVLRPSGLILVAFHIGGHVVHLDEWWEQAVDLDFRFLPVETVMAALAEAHFQVEVVVERAPYPEVEHQSRRAYLLARKA